MSDWKSWANEPATEPGVYRWRLPAQDSAGVSVRPEWSAEAVMRWAGHSKSLQPSFGHWDGYRMCVPDGLEWRELRPEEGGVDTVWVGSQIPACPFCGGEPSVVSRQRVAGGTVVGAIPPRHNTFQMHCKCGIKQSTWFDTFGAMLRAWAHRAHPHRAADPRA